MADMLEGYGVTHVFHVPAVLRKTFAAMESRTGIKRRMFMAEHDPKKPAPDLIRGGNRFSEKIMLRQKSIGGHHGGRQRSNLTKLPVLQLIPLSRII